MTSPTTEERFWAKVDRSDPDACWRWTAAINRGGYGVFGSGANTATAHRVAYKFKIGPIPEGLDLDHLCHTRDVSCDEGDLCLHRRCVNPAHLEPVTRSENTRRRRNGYTRAIRGLITHCRRGHAYSEANTRWRKDRYGRECRTCDRRSARTPTP